MLAAALRRKECKDRLFEDLTGVYLMTDAGTMYGNMWLLQGAHIQVA
jgi:hypothetical protein